jgi:hypothetical protein
MEIIGPKISELAQSKMAIEGLVRDFRVGQVLKAVAQSTTPQGLVQLAIGRQTLLARSPLPLPPGTRLTLQVEQAGDQPSLRMLDPPLPAAVKAEALRQVLPRMLELATALGKALETSTGTRSAEQLPGDVKQLAQVLARTIPPAAGALSGEGLRDAVSRSGLFNEASMARGRVPDADVKTALARLATRLRTISPTPAEPQGRSPTRVASETAVPARAPLPAAPTRGEPAATPGRPPATTNPTTQPAQTAAAGPRPQTGAAPPTPGGAVRQTIAPAAQAAAAGGGEVVVKPAGPTPAAPPPAETKGGAPAGKTDAAPAAGRQSETLAQGTQTRANPATIPSRALPADAPLPPMRTPPTPLPGAGNPTATTSQTMPGSSATAFPQAAAGTQSAVTGAKTLYPQVPNQPSAGQHTAQQPPQPTAAELPHARLVQDLASQVEGALSRIQYNQLSSLPGDDPNRQAWQLDLPFRDGAHLQSFHLRIEEEKHARALEHEGSTWRVDLAFDLAPLGPVRARIGLQGEVVSSVFWAEKPETVALIEKRLQVLEQGLIRVGLEVGRLSAHRGRPPARSPAPDERPDPGLLDEKA